MPDPASGASEYERVLDANQRYAATFDGSSLPRPPRRQVAVLTCMDARITVESALGLSAGDAHILRNAGALATDDAIRSLVISQNLTGTNTVLVIGHTDCGMLAFRDEELADRLHRETGHRADLPLLAFTDLEASVRDQVAAIRAHPWTRGTSIHGLVYDVTTGRLSPVE